jgi:hypothetical protein
MNLEEKGLETWVDYTLTRGPIRGILANKVGLLLTIKANPLVESFFSSLSKNQTIDVDAYGDLWSNAGGKETLKVYNVDEPFNNKSYNLREVGMPLLNLGGGRNGLQLGDEDAGVLNLSFLKLVGISNPDGVTLGISGAYSKGYIQKIQNKLPEATQRFLHDYVVPITVNLHLVSKPYRG